MVATGVEGHLVVVVGPEVGRVVVEAEAEVGVVVVAEHGVVAAEHSAVAEVHIVEGDTVVVVDMLVDAELGGLGVAIAARAKRAQIAHFAGWQDYNAHGPRCARSAMRISGCS